VAGGTTFEGLLIAAERPVLHLEIRDGYMRSDPEFVAWQQGKRYDPADKSSWWRPWLDTISKVVAHGVEVRRSSEINIYQRTFTALADMAVYGAEARELITTSIGE